MRRSYISPEYQNRLVSGTLNMREESTFFGAKMLEVEDILNINNQDIIYYQKDNGEQIDFSIETSLPSYVHSPSENKRIKHTLKLDDTQSKFKLENDTRWVLTINLKDILEDYIFSLLKKNRTFENVRGSETIYNNVDVAIRNYINFNIVNRYKYKNIELFVNYKDLRSQNILRYKNTWVDNIIDDKYKLTKLQSIMEFDGSSIKIFFNQDKPSSSFNFNYYFNIIFEKI